MDAFDISERVVEKAREFVQRERVSITFTLAGVDTFDWPEGLYDGVVAIFVQFSNPAPNVRAHRPQPQTRRRPHQALNMKTPAEAFALAA